MHCAKRGFGAWRMVVGCVDGLGRKERESPATVFGDQKRQTLDRLYCRYSYPLGRQTDSERDETWQAAYLHYNKTTRQLSPHSENIFRPLIK